MSVDICLVHTSSGTVSLGIGCGLLLSIMSDMHHLGLIGMSQLMTVCSIIAGELHRSVNASHTETFDRCFVVLRIFSVAVNPCHDAYAGKYVL